jgi:deoxyribodipyrimidine photo-lyase
VRRYVPELRTVTGRDVFRPWLMEGFERLDYPAPIVDHDEAAAEFRARREA